MNVRPAFHVHVSGSAGTSLCQWAYKQSPINVAGNAYACFLPCKGNLEFRQELTAYSPSKKCRAMYSSCANLESEMKKRRYHVIGMAETFLPEIGRALPRSFDSCPDKKCCVCNSLAINDRPYFCAIKEEHKTLKLRALQVEKGQISPLEAKFPVHAMRSPKTFCPNIAYTFLMNDPVKRIVSMLATKCAGCVNTSKIAECAAYILDDIEKRHLIVDIADGTYMMGTAAVNNYNIRMLLGPATFFAGIQMISTKHLQVAKRMLQRFTIISPVQNLSNLGPVLHKTLNWTSLGKIVSNRHKNTKSRKVIYNRLAPRIRLLNSYDIALYEFVKHEFNNNFPKYFIT